ncbi:MAG: hypothetical protein Kow00114_41840 [Kiloniellaceae bacterium]
MIIATMKACLAAGCLLLLAACSLPATPAGVFDADAPAFSAADVSASQGLGDRLFGEAASVDVRQARQVMVVAGYSYLLAERATRFDPEIAGEALGRLEILRGALDGAGGLPPGDTFSETALGSLTLELGAIAVETGLERGTRLAALIAQLSPTGLLERARVAARQGFTVSTLLHDVRAAVARMNADPAEIARTTADSRLLLCLSENRIRGMTGAAARDCGEA